MTIARLGATYSASAVVRARIFSSIDEFTGGLFSFGGAAAQVE